MEGGKRGEEAGPSSGGSSSACVGDQRQEKQKEMGEKPMEVRGVVEEEEEEDHDDDGVVDGYVPGPLVSLKEQIEKDKVLFCFPFFCSVLHFGTKRKEKGM
jgi:Rho GDP-dissociation inhibitor